MNEKDIPLGKVMHIVGNEAIVRPGKSIQAPGARVVNIENHKIGVLQNPIGPVENPYIPILLDDPKNTSIVGKLVIAQIRKKKRRKRRYRKRKN